mgnify:CR=1 FL=1
MEIETYLYPYSANEARKRGELALWRASHQANISCKRAIEESIRQNFDGMHLNNGCVDEVIAKYHGLSLTVEPAVRGGMLPGVQRSFSSFILFPPTQAEYPMD